MTSETNCQKLLFELQNEISKLEIENATLKERIKVAIPDSEVKRMDWI